MRRNHADTGIITGIAEATAERVRLSGELLQAMAEAMARTEKIQQRFATIVLMKLARIEAVLAQVHVSHLVQDQRVEYYGEKLTEDAQAAEEWISRTSFDSGTAAVKYIYGEAEEASAKPKKRRMWADCPEYEI